MPRLGKRVKAAEIESGLLNIKAVAKRARVSVATVSRTINRVPTVNAKMTKRVWAAISELGYTPNPYARSLGSGRSGVIGLIVPEITNPFFSELVREFEDVALENGYQILISSINDDPKRIEFCIRRQLQRNVEGVAILTFGIEQALVEQLVELGTPLVFIDAGPNCPGVTGPSEGRLPSWNSAGSAASHRPGTSKHRLHLRLDEFTLRPISEEGLRTIH